MSRRHPAFDYDVVVLGGGSGGYAAAHTAAAAGKRVAVVDGGSALGGLCILRGCMPSKALLYAAEVRHLASISSVWGLRIPRVGFDFKAVMARKKGMVEEFAHYRRSQLTSGKFKLFRATSRFIDKHTVALEHPLEKTPKTVSARHFVIATGSVIAPPPVRELEEVGYWTSDNALSATHLPKSLIVLGGGLVAVELAQFFARFDVKVTIIQRGPHLLRECDPDAATTLANAFRHEGVALHTDTELLSAFRKGKLKGVTFKQGGRVKQVLAEEILMAAGRIPATANLGLETIGVRAKKGLIQTNAAMQTSVSHIYAAGDCTGPHQIVHIGVEQGEIAAHNILHPQRPKKISYRLLLSVAFTDPQIAIVGLTEKRAHEEKIPYLTASYEFNDHGKAMIMAAKHGFVKLLANPRTGEIIGGACVGPLAGELIHEIVAAMHHRMKVGELAAMPHYHPTLAEIWTYPASELAEKIK